MEPDEVDGKITKAPYRALRDLTHLKAGETDRIENAATPQRLVHFPLP